MRFVKKSECSFKDGYLMDATGELISLDPKVKAQLEHLDCAWQAFQYLSEQEPFHPAPSLEGFHYITAEEDSRRWKMLDRPDTPTLDERLSKSLAFRDECIAVQNTETVNAYASGKMAELLDFASSDEFIPSRNMPDRINCVALGNPLQVKADDIMQMLLALAEDEHAILLVKE